MRIGVAELRGIPLTIQGQQLTPIGQSLRLEWPHGAFIWHRPIAVEVATRGHARRVRIHNATRRTLVALVLAQLLFGVLVWWWRRTNSSGGDD